MTLFFIWCVGSKSSSFSLYDRAEMRGSSDTVCTKFPSCCHPTLICHPTLDCHRKDIQDSGQEMASIFSQRYYP